MPCLFFNLYVVREPSAHIQKPDFERGGSHVRLQNSIAGHGLRYDITDIVCGDLVVAWLPSACHHMGFGQEFHHAKRHTWGMEWLTGNGVGCTVKEKGTEMTLILGFLMVLAKTKAHTQYLCSFKQST